MQALLQSHRTSRVGRLGHFCNLDIVLFLLHIRGLKPLLVFYFRMEEKFAGGKLREIPFGVDIIFARGKFRAKSKFAKVAKIYSTRKIGVIQYTYYILTFVMLSRQSRYLNVIVCIIAIGYFCVYVGPK